VADFPRRKRLPQVDARALGAECDTCPLDGQSPTLPTVPPDNRPPKVTVVLDGPTELDNIKGRAGQGKSAVFLHHIWSRLNVKREEAAVRSATMCWPEGKVGDGALKAAVTSCRPRLAKELERDGPPSIGSVSGRDLVLLCGSKALQSITGKTSIDDWRGFPVHPLASGETQDQTTDLQSDSGPIYFPTYAPKDVLAKPQLWHIFKRDLRVAWDYSHGRIAPLEWPDLYLDNATEASGFLVNICERLEAGEQIDVGVDVETKGDWTTRLLLVGIATTEGSASMLYPFADEHLDAYVRFILAHPNATLVVQNGNHDRLSLEKHGFKCGNKWWDTIVAGRVAYPDLPHDLGFLATLFFFVDRWKSNFHAGSSNDAKGGEGWDRYLHVDRLESFLRYNAKDALSQVLMKKPLKERLAYVPQH